MIHSLLSLMLTATQVLSGNSVPLYLCLEADGSVCVDFGPTTCGCCHADEDAEVGAEHRSCDHRPGDPLAAHGGEHAAGDCPCTHVQISEPQIATVQRIVSPPDDQHSVAPAAIVPAGLGSCAASAGDDILSARLVDGSHCALAERASVVLRC